MNALWPVERKVFRYTGYFAYRASSKKLSVVLILFSVMFSPTILAVRFEVFSACNAGDLKYLRMLTGKWNNIGVQPQDFDGLYSYPTFSNPVTCLMVAASRGHNNIVEYLLQHTMGATTTKRHETALHFAAHSGHLDVVKTLLDHRFDVNAQNVDGDTPLSIAIRQIDQSAENVALYLIERGAEFHWQDNNGSTALHLAAKHGYKRLVSKLLQLHANPHAEDKFGSSTLLYSVRNQSPDIANMLIAQNLNVNKANDHGTTPLMRASEKGHSKVVEALLKAGANAKLMSPQGSALMHAAMNGHAHIIEQLAQAGARVNEMDRTRNQPIHIAAALNHLKAVKTLVKLGADVDGMQRFITPLFMAATNGHTDMVKLLLSHGASPETLYADIPTPYQMAAHNSKLEVMKELVKKSVDVNSITSFPTRGNALFTAAKKGNWQVAKLLLQHKADPRITTPLTPHIHCSPMEAAIFKGHRQTVFQLAQDPRSTSSVGTLGVMAAAIQGMNIRGTAEANPKKEMPAPVHMLSSSAATENNSAELKQKGDNIPLLSLAKRFIIPKYKH